MIRIPRPIYQKMIEHAKKEKPLECCGILSGKGETVEKVFELQNAEGSPTRYSIPPQEQLRAFEKMEEDLPFPSSYPLLSVGDRRKDGLLP
jgi:proteasome lid subunit RPN8/RPN11